MHIEVKSGPFSTSMTLLNTKAAFSFMLCTEKISANATLARELQRDGLSISAMAKWHSIW
jgi:hypothetical protein